MRHRSWTKGELEWLTENYPVKTNYFCRTFLHISNTRLLNKVKEMGLEKAKGAKPDVIVRKPQPQKPKIYLDADAPGGYCMDCTRYSNGVCRKKGKDVGALWQKKCFKGEGNPPHNQMTDGNQR
jgi:hypothetical protein